MCVRSKVTELAPFGVKGKRFQVTERRVIGWDLKIEKADVSDV